MPTRSLHATAATVLAGLVLAPSALSAADLFAVHGIDGRDLGLPQALPVDISVDGPGDGEPLCLAGVQFGQTAGPVADQPAGAYLIEVRLPDGDAGCGGTLVVSGMFDVSLFDTAAFAAHVDTTAAPVVSKFNVDVSPLAAGQTRLALAHAARAPLVDARVTDDATHRDVASFFDVTNGDSTFPADLPAGVYRIRVSPADPRSNRFRHPLVDATADLMPDRSYLSLVVGSVANETLGAVTLVVETD